EVGLVHRNPGEDEYYLIAQFCAAAPVYSVLSAFVGEIDAARLAGMIAAKNAEIARAPAATDKASGSQLETPYSWAEIRRPAPMANGTPNSRPTSTRAEAPRRTSRTTFARSAPSAMRIPISLVRCATVYAVTTYIPTAASRRATIPNRPARLATARC